MLHFEIREADGRMLTPIPRTLAAIVARLADARQPTAVRSSAERCSPVQRPDDDDAKQRRNGTTGMAYGAR